MSNRLLRVNQLLQREISSYLHQHYGSETVAITITSAEVTGDLREAKVYYSVIGDAEVTAKAGKFLSRKLREIRAVVAKNVILRQVPLLAFVHDDHAPRTLRIEQLLADIDEKEKKP